MRKEYFIRALALAWGVSVLALAAHAGGVTNTFEDVALGTTPSPWTGYCYVSNNVGSYAKDPPGCPVKTAGHTKMLSVEGTAEMTCVDSGDRAVELLVMAEELPDEELPAAGGDEHLKLAFDTNGCINLYHKPSAGAAARWSKLSDTVYPQGTWVRLSFLFDYTHHLCQLKIDGSPCVSSNGYRSATNLTSPGSWYCMASNATSLAKIDFVGCGGVDDVVNASDGYVPSSGTSTATNGVDFAWFDKNGLAWTDPDTTRVPGDTSGSGYTLKEAFDAGTDPFSSNKLYVAEADYDNTYIVLTLNGYGKTYKVEKKSVPFTDGTSDGEVVTPAETIGDEASNTTTLKIPFPDGELTYYRVRNTSVATAETVNQFAIMKIVSSATNTLVALPWKSLSADTNNPSAITAANVVMTNNLSKGDALMYYDSTYKGWLLQDDGWHAVNFVTPVGSISVTAADVTELERGRAIWVVRQDTSKPFYLYGQYQATSGGSVSVPSGGALLAKPDVHSSFVVSDARFTGTVNNGDEIRVPNGSRTPKIIKKFSAEDGGWKAEKITVGEEIKGPDGNMYRPSTKTWSTDSGDLTIPPGQGFLYVPGASAVGPTVNW